MWKPQVFQVTSTVYCVRRPSYLTCSYILNRPQGLVLVDAGMKSDGSDMLYALDKLGRHPKDIKAILLTHWHGDHSAGASALQDLSDCRIFYHPKEKPYLFGTVETSSFRNWLAVWVPEWGIFTLLKGLLMPAVPHPIHKGTPVLDKQNLERDFQVLETPGHTEGHVGYFYKPEKILFCGDALAVVGEKIRFMSRPVTLDIPRSLISMERCLKTKMEILCPGHRQPLKRGVKEQKAALLKYISTGGAWPFWG